MSGAIEMQHLLIGIGALSLTGAATDLLWGRIYNWLTLPAIVLGIAVSAWTGGWAGFGGALLAVAAGFALYGWMYWFGAMGAGDVKFLMAFGAWGGTKYVVEVAILGVLLGGVMALVHLLTRGKPVDFALRMGRFFRSALVPHLVLESPRIDEKLTLPFGLPIAIAACWVALGQPLHLLGVSLW